MSYITTSGTSDDPRVTMLRDTFVTIVVVGLGAWWLFGREKKVRRNPDWREKDYITTGIAADMEREERQEREAASKRYEEKLAREAREKKWAAAREREYERKRKQLYKKGYRGRELSRALIRGN